MLLQMNYDLGILGAGNMAEAIVRGILSRGLIAANQIIAADPSPERRKFFTEQLGVKTTSENADAACSARMLLLATKPYQIKDVLGALKDVIDQRSLLISIAAGIRMAAIEQALGDGKNWRIVRAMPNTPMLVGEGAVGLSAGKFSGAEDMAAACGIFESAGVVVEVTEEQLDSVTAVSGSGPAYFFYVVEAMVRAGVDMGLDESAARLLAAKTCLGAGKLLASSADSPAELRRKVTTPGGTTHAAISSMEAHDLAGIIIDAMKAARKRAIEMGA